MFNGEAISRRTWIMLVPVVVFGCGLAIVVSSRYRAEEEVALQVDLERIVDERAASFERELSLNVEPLYALQALFVASEEVTHEEFAVAVQNIAVRHNDIMALGWVPRVSAKAREAFEKKQRGYIPHYQITERAAQGAIIPAARRDEYYPVSYLEPYAGNEEILGLDLATDPVRLAALRNSVETGTLQLTEGITLVQGEEARIGFLALMPVFDGMPETVEARWQNLRGFVLGMYFVQELFEKALAGFPPAGVEMKLFDLSADGERKLLHHHRSRSGQAAGAPFSSLKRLDTFGGRQWAFSVAPTALFVKNRMSWIPSLILATGSFFTFIVAIYLAMLERRTHVVNDLVRRRTRELEASDARNRAILDTAKEGIITTDGSGIIMSFNPAAEALFDYPCDEAIGQNLSLLIPKRTQDGHTADVQAILQEANGNENGSNIEVCARRKGGQVLHLDLGVSEIILDQSRMYTIILRDVTERKRMEEELRIAASVDSPTNLLNRRSLTELLNANIAAARRHAFPLSLAICDLDKFKDVNDTYGHSTGDQVLIALGRTLKDGVRTEDIVGRFGGDEFCLVFTHVDAAHAAHSLERIRKTLNAIEFKTENGATFSVSASFGIADLDAASEQTADQLLDTADQSLYLAKNAGRNRIAVNGSPYA